MITCINNNARSVKYYICTMYYRYMYFPKDYHILDICKNLTHSCNISLVCSSGEVLWLCTNKLNSNSYERKEL